MRNTLQSPVALTRPTFVQATAEAFAQASAKRVLLVGRRLDVVAAARDELRKKYPDCEIYAESCDVTKAEDVAKVFAICKEHNTEIDVLVNNAGFALGMGPVKDSVPVDWWKTFVRPFSLRACAESQELTSE